MDRLGLVIGLPITITMIKLGEYAFPLTLRNNGELL